MFNKEEIQGLLNQINEETTTEGTRVFAELTEMGFPIKHMTEFIEMIKMGVPFEHIIVLIEMIKMGVLVEAKVVIPTSPTCSSPDLILTSLVV